ncbi:unnamed protein product, partial [marine sediment metagenome]
FVAGGSLWSFGAVSPDLPAQISQIADGGYATVGALASPFGTPMVASTETVSEVTSYKLAYFSGYDLTTTWKSVIIPCTFGRMRGYIDEISVLTRALGGLAEDVAGATLTIESDQATVNSTSKSITTIGKIRHTFNGFGLGGITDFRIAISLNGSTTYPCKIRSIQGRGHWVES